MEQLSNVLTHSASSKSRSSRLTLKVFSSVHQEKTNAGFGIQLELLTIAFLCCNVTHVYGQTVQLLSCGCGIMPASATVYSVVQSPYLPQSQAVAAGPPMMPLTTAPGMPIRGKIRPGVPPAIVPIAPMIPFVHHPAVMMHGVPMSSSNIAPRPDRESGRKSN